MEQFNKQTAIEEFLKRAPEWRQARDKLTAIVAKDGTDHDRAQHEYVISVDEHVIGRVSRIGSKIYATCIM